MSERLPLPAELLSYRAGPARVERDASAVVHKLLDLADRGDHVAAAEQAAELLRGPNNDVRLIAIYLAGSFAERGVPALPEVLACVNELLGPSVPTPAATGKTVDSALEWLFRSIGDRLGFHTTVRDAVWDAWIRATTPTMVAQIIARSEAIVAANEGGEAMQRLARWARGKLAPAVERAERARVAAEALAEPEPAPEPEPEDRPEPAARAPSWDDPEADELDGVEDVADFDDDDDDDDDDEYDDDDDRDDDEFDPRAGIDLEPPQLSSTTVIIDSPALAQLRDKLLGFEIVLARGEIDKAAVIARDIQAIIDDFDPITYMPGLFARYAQLLHAAHSDLEACWQAAEQPSFRVLVQFYRSNFAGFIDE